MERRKFITSTTLGAVGIGAGNLSLSGLIPEAAAAEAEVPKRTHFATRKILIAGGGFNEPFIRYMAELTGKTRPKICYLPTASADSADGSISLFENCAPLDVEPFVQNSFIASTQQTQSWEECCSPWTASSCSGGNTLNQQAIWKAQGIDVVLRQAWDRGIVLGGASAGSLCWFEEGTTDSRPKELTTVKCLGFLKGSHSPHYDREPAAPAAVSEADRLGPDEARLRLRQRRRASTSRTTT